MPAQRFGERRGYVTCYMDDIWTSRHFGEEQPRREIASSIQTVAPHNYSCQRFESSSVGEGVGILRFFWFHQLHQMLYGTTQALCLLESSRNQ